MKKKILVVDDQEDSRFLIMEHIEKSVLDTEVTEAKSGLAAVAILKRKTFDCIISDFNMPNGKGIEIVKYLKKWDLRVPVIFLTGNVGQAMFEIKDLQYFGPLKFIEKPNLALLNQTLKCLMVKVS